MSGPGAARICACRRPGRRSGARCSAPSMRPGARWSWSPARASAAPTSCCCSSGWIGSTARHLAGPAARWCWCWTLIGKADQPDPHSKATAKALAARPWLTVESLPKYAPELNAIEHCWHDLKRHFLAHQTFASADQLDAAIHRAVADLNEERQAQTWSNLCMAA